MELLERIPAERLHRLTGHAPPYIFPLARYLWFRKHRDARRVATLLMLNDWITYLLCGERVAEHSNAGESMLYDVSRRAWSEEILGALDIPAHILPPLAAPGARAGSVTAAAAAATGLPGAPPGERQIFCHLGPVVFNLADMSPFKPAGMLFRFPLLHLDRPLRGEVLHAYLESIAYAIRGNCEQIAAVAGRPIPVLALSGGMTQSPTLVRLVADTLGLPVSVAAVLESASLGCAMPAAVGAGVYP